MPEEINRVVTDCVSGFASRFGAVQIANLRKEGRAYDAIHLVGRHLPGRSARNTYTQYSLIVGKYALLTLHRPSNVDDPDTLRLLWDSFKEFAGKVTIVFQLIPDCAKTEEIEPSLDKSPRLRLVDPELFRRIIFPEAYTVRGD